MKILDGATLFMRDEGVEPRFAIVCTTHGQPEQFTTEEAQSAGLRAIIKDHVEHLHKPEVVCRHDGLCVRCGCMGDD